MVWVAGVLAVVALLYLGLALVFVVLQERFIFIRFRTAERYRFHFPGAHSEEWLSRPDGARLHALAFPAATPKGTVLYFHGNTGTVKRWGKQAARFTALGYNVLMPDPRGYGKSHGRLSEKELINDAVAWFDRLREQAGAMPVVVYGRSMGSGLAVPVAAQREARLLLLETPFNNLIDVVWWHLPMLPYRWLLRYPFRNDVAVRGVTCPVYVFHGKHDGTVPLSSALKLYAAIPATLTREAFIFPKGHHNDLYNFPLFREQLRRLLARV